MKRASRQFAYRAMAGLSAGALALVGASAQAQRPFRFYSPSPPAVAAPAPVPIDPALGGGAAAAPVTRVVVPVPRAVEPNTTGRSEHARLGITLSDNTQGKVWVRSVEPNSAAADCGLRPNDQIIAIDDKKIENYLDVVRYINTKGASDDITIYLLRNGRPAMLTAALASEYAGPYTGSVSEYPGNIKQRSYSAPTLPGTPTRAPGYVVPNDLGPFAR